MDLGRGWCTKTISNEEQFVDDTHLLNGKTWFDIRNSMVVMPSESWKEIKAFIIQICKENNTCSDISSWDRTLNRIDSQLESPDED